MPPSIRYASTDDGVQIAFATLGEGAPVLCLPPFPFSHVEAGWDLDGQRRWYEGLARGTHIALFDARGTGLSDRERAEFTLDAMTRDLEAVAGRLGWEQFALCGLFNGAPVAIAYAARHPEAVTDLILWGGYAKGADAYPFPLPADAPEAVPLYWPIAVDTAARMWTAGDDADAVAAFFARCVEPATALRAFAAAREYDVEALLPSVRARTLVLHRAHARAQRSDLAQMLAARIPNAEIAPLEGDAASPFAGDVEAAVRTIAAFLGIADASAPPGHAAEPLPEDLTPREIEVLRLLARGRANKEIAGELELSIHTVERHLTNLYPKIGCRSRTEAAAFAITHGLS
jgi:pimeloyl-ACP methyl ester carboxylesterase/DNA-binding CsgD family transcriptional regulator